MSGPGAKANGAHRAALIGSNGTQAMLPDQSVPWNSLFGRLSLSVLPLGSSPEDRILQYTFLGIAVIAVAALAFTTRQRKWGYLWREFLTSVDHK
jgi:cytochrome o ubiquinol oxidase subunit 1